jgi:hypothetical protein
MSGAETLAGLLLVGFLFMTGLTIYFVPTIVASSRKKTNLGAIFALNFFQGWTLVGWVMALVWVPRENSGYLS